MSQNLGIFSHHGLKSSLCQISHGTRIRCTLKGAVGRTSIDRLHIRHASSQPSLREVEQQHQRYHPPPNTTEYTKTPYGQSARQVQADREFFTSLLSSAATKRDAKAYISRLKSPTKIESAPPPRAPSPRPQVNLGGLFRTVRAVEQSPLFRQYEPKVERFKEEETLHVALIKLSDVEQIPDHVLVGIAETLCQLARLDMSPCVVIESFNGSNGELRQQLKIQADRLATAIDAMSGGNARVIENVLSISKTHQLNLSFKKLLAAPLRRGLIPIVLPLAYSETQQKIVTTSADETMVALTEGFAEARLRRSLDEKQRIKKQISLDRVIVISPAGGIPNPESLDGNHVFLNLEQEFTTVSRQFSGSRDTTSKKHLANLRMFRQALACLPNSASGLIATPEEAANISKQRDDESAGLTVGTRRQKNALIHNLLTDKPAYSSSLPKTRLSKLHGAASLPSAATFIKHGMPLTILPDPSIQPWTADGPRIKLTDPQIDLDRLVHLVNDSFNRELDVEEYLKRVNDRMAGVIIVGDYEGGAILTWETPPGVSDTDTSRLVPYLDKFAVLKKSQGAGGVADILFNAMVRTCFPQGVCWRSRKDNPVNKWYFERSRGTKKISDMNWTMFWTTPGVPEDEPRRFLDYEDVCRGIEPTWVDKSLAPD